MDRFRGEKAAFFALVLAAGCGGKVGDGGSPGPAQGPTTSDPSPNVPASDGGTAFAKVPCASGTLATFPGESALRIAIAGETGAIVTTSKDGAGRVRVRVLRDAKKGLEDLATTEGSGAVAVSPTHVAWADGATTVVTGIDGTNRRVLASGAATFLGFRDKDVVVAGASTVVRFPLDGSAALPICLGSTCTVGAIVSFDARAGTIAIVDQEGALYMGAEVGLRRVATFARGPVAVGAGFVAFTSGSGAERRLALYRPLEDETELFSLPAASGPSCAASEVDVLGLASDGARLAFATKESYPCGSGPAHLAFASRATRPQDGKELSTARGTRAVAATETCVYTLVERTSGDHTDTDVVAVESAR